MKRDLRKAEDEKSGEKRPTTGTNGNKINESSRTSEWRVDQPHPPTQGKPEEEQISGKESSKGIFEGFLKGFSCNCMNILFANLSFAQLGQESRSAIITRSYYNVQQICKQSHGLMGYWSISFLNVDSKLYGRQLNLTIYTIILLMSVCLSVGVRKVQVAILARSSRKMYLTVRIVWQYILSRVRVSVRPSIFFICEKPSKPWGNLASVPVFI